MSPCVPDPTAWPSCGRAVSRTPGRRSAALPRALGAATLVCMEKLRPIAVTSALFAGVPVAMSLIPLLAH
jgi:hypothetical protein